jgi:DNA-binding response OmpR family regulator
MAGIWSLRQLFARDREEVQGCETGSTGEMLEVGDFRIDTRRHTAMLRGVQLELTGEEFNVLVFLTTNPQHVVTPQTTLATHWSGARTQQTKLLKVLLSLRKKLDAAEAGQQYLRTEPWVIYRFDPLPSSAR